MHAAGASAHHKGEQRTHNDPTAHGDPSLKKAAQLQWSDNNGSFGVTSITDRPFVLVILGQTFVSMRQMAV